ncbi:hypothetical protein [Sphingomonas sp. 3-13AW]|uniref:hypothetical protein n=1 Tax=Sphingomonas sp. 3-13AW TaxID=3050450 RepID=UPI003BB7502F
MSIHAVRASLARVKWGRVLPAVALVGFLGFIQAEPAYAAFGQFEERITSRTSSAAGVTRTILFAAAVVSLLVGAAPMLWGQVKVKWMITALCACVVFGVIGSLVNAFTGDSSGTETMTDITS